MSNWRLTRLLLDAVIAVIKPCLSLVAIDRARRERSRHLSMPKRKRPYKRAIARFVGGLS